MWILLESGAPGSATTAKIYYIVYNMYCITVSV